MPNRPWHRPEYTTPPTPGILDLATAADEDVRAYCLNRARSFLARAEDTHAVVDSERPLKIAARYAAIAEAFRPDRSDG